ncbi:MAG: hypothetical protein PHW04_03620 [Candidatus Wallbacteria bacterium]|nr:hypothetical protein [Candidatus Wallbacteria bacterium]
MNKKPELNIFDSLFGYRPRPDRKPMEDFLTQAFAYVLGKNKAILNSYLQMIHGKPQIQSEDFEIITQQSLDTCRIDLMIYWTHSGNRHCLFVEHKTGSSPWEDCNDQGDPINQIQHYCDVLKKQNSLAGDQKCHVALISPLLLKDYSRAAINRPEYLGNFTWGNLAGLLEKFSSENEIIAELLEFLRRQGMTSENFTLSELASIGMYITYLDKLNSLNLRISETFTGPLEAFAREKGLEYKMLWGELIYSFHYGVLLFSGPDPNASPVWLICGISNRNKSCVDDQGYPALMLKDQAIPDVECGVIVGEVDFNKLNEMLGKAELSGFEQIDGTKYKNPFYAILARKPLSDFLCSDHHDTGILEFLGKGIAQILAENSVFRKIVDEFRQTENTAEKT